MSKRPLGLRSNAAAFSAAGVRGDVRRVAKGLIAGCRNVWASSWSTSKSSSSGPSDCGESCSGSGGELAAFSIMYDVVEENTVPAWREEGSNMAN